MQELGKFNLKISVLPNGLEKWVLLSLTSYFFDSFQFLSFSWDSLVKNLNKDDLKSRIFFNVIDLVQQK